MNRRQIVFYTCCVMVFALIYSKFLLSIGMIVLLLCALFNVDTVPAFKLSFNPLIWKNIKGIFSARAFLAITVFFFLVLISAVYSGDTGYTLERLRIKLPFLLLPLAFLCYPAFSKRQYYSIFYCLLIIAAGSAILVGINYWMDYEQITESMLRGQAIPTPTNHIRYSLILALAILSGTTLWWKGFYWKYKWETWLILGLTFLLVLMIHVLSVRSGLFVLYISAGLLSLRFIFLSKRYWLGFGIILCLIGTPFIAYKTIPSLQAKVAYVRYDFDQFLHGNSKSLSDAERFISMAAGLKIAKAHPLIGVGAGDLKKEIRRIYEEDYPELEKAKMPHNQFISVLAGTGSIGLFIFIIAFFYPLFYKKNYKDTLFLVLHIILFFSFFIENTIETAVGVAFYLLFLLIGLNYIKGRNPMLRA